MTPKWSPASLLSIGKFKNWLQFSTARQSQDAVQRRVSSQGCAHRDDGETLSKALYVFAVAMRKRSVTVRFRVAGREYKGCGHRSSGRITECSHVRQESSATTLSRTVCISIALARNKNNAAVGKALAGSTACRRRSFVRPLCCDHVISDCLSRSSCHRDSDRAVVLAVISERRIHLGVTGFPEWDEFAADPPESSRLEIRFNAEKNASEATLFIRQRDVKQEWIVQLNERRIGKLFLMEADLVHTLSIPPGTLRNGENLLTVFPGAPETRDDIVLHEMSLDTRPPRQATCIGTLTIEVDDQEGRPLPSRITIVDQNGALAAMASAGVESPTALRPGVAYTANGRAQIGLRPGPYKVFASRGFEYGVAIREVQIRSDELQAIALRSPVEVPTPGLVSCDTHIHTFTHSRHGDATLRNVCLRWREKKSNYRSPLIMTFTWTILKPRARWE
jgi:hypothetical protein